MSDLRRAFSDALDLNRALRSETLDDLMDAFERWAAQPSGLPNKTGDFIPCRYCNGTLPEGGEMQHEPTCPWNLGKLAAIEAMTRNPR